MDIVPRTVVNMGGNEDGSNNSGTIIDTLLKFITVEKLGVSLTNPSENVIEEPVILVESNVKQADVQ